MTDCTAAALTVALLVAPWAGLPARADNSMGYRLLAQDQADELPRNQGSLGLDIERAQQLTDDGMTFDTIRVKQVRRGSPARAGLTVGDQIIAVDGEVFPSLTVISRYVGSKMLGSPISIGWEGDAAGAAGLRGGRGTGGTSADPSSGQANAPAAGGMSTGTEIAIGVGAAVLLGRAGLLFASFRRVGTTGWSTTGAVAYSHSITISSCLVLLTSRNRDRHSASSGGRLRDKFFPAG